MIRRITDFDVMPYVEHTTDIIAACKAVDAELTTPPADNMAKCAEALAALSEGVRDVRRIMDAPGTWQSVLEAARDALDDVIAKTTTILEGETP